METNVVLSPIQEYAPGQVSAIRNEIIRALVTRVSRELTLPEENLVVRDIRAYDDLGFGNNTDYMATATAANIWGTFKRADTYIKTAAAAGYGDAIADSTAMADQRYVALFGVRDWRMSRPTTNEAIVSLIKFDVGAADRAIWDLSKCEAYKNYIAGISPSAVVIPPLAPYQISMYLVNATAEEPCVQLMGVVVEPVGLLIVP